MTIKKNAYIVLDTETSGFSKLVFDLGWITRDKKGNVIDSASYLMLDVIATERPYFMHKVKGYTSKAISLNLLILLLLEDYLISILKVY